MANLRDFNPWLEDDLSRVPETVRQTMRNRCVTETYYLAYNILGFDKLKVETHGPLCTFLDTCYYKRRLIQMPRTTFKTTLTTVTKRIQDVLKDSGLRILIVGDTDTNAQRHLSKIKLQFERNRLLRWLFPERFWEDTSQAMEWSKRTLFLPTTAVHGEPTFDTIGAGGGAVSRHYNIIGADDIIAEAEAYSPTEMDRSIEWSTGLESLLVPPISEGQIDFPSTYWRKDDVYAFVEEYFGGNNPKIPTGPYSYVRGNLAVFRRGALEDGKSIFPEHLTIEFLQRLQEQNPERYAAQYANDPISSALTTFRPEYRRYYDQRSDDGWIISYRHERGEIEIIRVDSLFRVSMCDPHAGGTQRQKFRGGRAAVITTGVDARKGRIFILDAWIKRAPTNEIVDEILRQNEKWSPEVFSIEANGLQKMLKFWIDERVERDYRRPVPYDPFLPQGDKEGDQRIGGLQPLYRAGQIYHAHGMLELEEEYIAYPRGRRDGLDALSQGLKYWNVGWDTVEQEVYNEYERALMGMRSVVTGY